MCARATQIESGNGRCVSRGRRHRSHEENLVEHQFALRDRPAAQSKTGLDVEWCKHSPFADSTAEAWQVTLERSDGELGHRITRAIPIHVAQSVRGVLDMQDGDVPARGRELRLRHAGETQLDDRLLGTASVLS